MCIINQTLHVRMINETVFLSNNYYLNG
jgi:hypothetical protein